jgi:hypothetical protein
VYPEVVCPPAGLGEANININCAYAAVEPRTNAPLLFFGVEEVGRQQNSLTESPLPPHAGETRLTPSVHTKIQSFPRGCPRGL